MTMSWNLLERYLQKKHQLKTKLWQRVEKSLETSFEYFYYEYNFTQRRKLILNFLGDEKKSQVQSGVLHIGASSGQEASFYNSLGLKVLWVEADPTIYKDLVQNISNFPNQRAHLALLGDRRRKANFLVTNNSSLSSSVFSLTEESKDRWKVEQNESIQLQMKPLDQCLSLSEVQNFTYWVLDVQGAELLVLKGATKSLLYCHVIEIEVSTFPTYEGAPLLHEIDEWLALKGFKRLLNVPTRFHGNTLFTRVKNIV